MDSQSDRSAVLFSGESASHGHGNIRLRWLGGRLPNPEQYGSAIFWGACTWLELVWFPSLFTGLLFRGGALLRLFGLALVNRRGQRASGLRVLIRMFFSGLFPLAAIVAYGFLSSIYDNSLAAVSKQQVVAAFLVLVACVAVVIYRSRTRLFSDRYAGTYLVTK
ncbi:MAG: hypothetical protein WBD31_18680 [Rubripirellula sp.]